MLKKIFRKILEDIGGAILQTFKRALFYTVQLLKMSGHYLATFVSWCIQTLLRIWREEQLIWQEQLAFQRQSQLSQYARVCSLRISEQLFTAFRGQTYATLTAITSARQIRTNGWKTENGYTFFSYRLLAKNIILTAAELNRIKRDMNTDLQRLRDQLLMEGGEEAFFPNKEELYRGIYIVSVENSPDADNEIFVNVIVNGLVLM